MAGSQKFGYFRHSGFMLLTRSVPVVSLTLTQSVSNLLHGDHPPLIVTISAETTSKIAKQIKSFQILTIIFVAIFRYKAKMSLFWSQGVSIEIWRNLNTVVMSNTLHSFTIHDYVTLICLHHIQNDFRMFHSLWVNLWNPIKDDKSCNMILQKKATEFYALFLML